MPALKLRDLIQKMGVEPPEKEDLARAAVAILVMWGRLYPNESLPRTIRELKK